jgi:hypothetical protein
MRFLKPLAISLALMAASACVFAAEISKADLIACLLGEPVDVICPED